MDGTPALPARADAGERRAFDRGHGRMLALRPEALESDHPRAGWFDDWFEEEQQKLITRYGTAIVVHVRGPLTHHNEWFFDSYDAISQRVDMALAANPRPTAIVLALDTPGGDVSGLFELCGSIRKRCEDELIPLVSYVEGMACSAGYALACAAPVVVASPTSIVGSIGVITAIVDATGAIAANGYKVRVIKSGARKADGHPCEPMSRDAEDATQFLVDALAEQFFAHVASARPSVGGVDGVRALEAGVVIGAHAQPIGLIDSVATLEGAIDIATARRPAAAPAPAPADAARRAGVATSPTNGARAARKKKASMTTKPALRAEDGAAESTEPKAATEECDITSLRDAMSMPDQPAQEVVDAAAEKIKGMAQEETDEGEDAKSKEKSDEEAEKKADALAVAVETLKAQVASQSAELAQLRPLAVREAEREREVALDAELAKRKMAVAPAQRAAFSAVAKKHGLEAAIASIDAAHVPPQGLIGGPPPKESTGATDPATIPSAGAGNFAAQMKAIDARVSELAAKPENAGVARHLLVSRATRQLSTERPDLFPAG